MRILLSAFACTPGLGSEGGCGWKYAARLSENHEVWVITDATRRAQIEAHPLHDRPNLNFVYYRPAALKGAPLNSRTALLVYEAWQMGAWRVARALDQEHDFDFIWHLTYGSFRHPSHYWRVGKPFVFGPLGGGETSPKAIRRGLRLRDQAKEWVRDATNALVLARPGLRASYRKAALIMVRTEDTRAALPAAIRADCPLQQDIGAYLTERAPHEDPGGDHPFRALFVGRLLWWKGINLALRATASAREQGEEITLTIIGDGPAEEWLKALAADLGLGDLVTFVKRMSQEQLFQRYTSYDVLLFPSLHDSGGNVVLESLSYALPVICLDVGGPPTLVNERCGIVVPSRKSDTAEVARALGSALVTMSRDRDLRASLSQGAVRRAAELTWEKQIDRCLDLIQTRVFRHQGETKS